jgi:hypothetical protein
VATVASSQATVNISLMALTAAITDTARVEPLGIPVVHALVGGPPGPLIVPLRV